MATKGLRCADAFKSIVQLLDTIKELNLHSLVNGTLLGVTTAIEELTKKVKKHPDSRIEFELENLRQKLEELKVLISDGFIPACESVAKFASNPEQLKRIRADLQAGNVGSLQGFLRTLGKRFDNCKECANTFTAEYNALEKSIYNAIHTHAKEEERLKQDMESKEAQHGHAVMAGGAAVTAGVLGAISGGIGLVGGSVAYLVFSGGLLGGLAFTGAAGGLRVALKFTQEDYALMVTVTDRINKMNKEMKDLNNKKFRAINLALKKAEKDLATVVERGQPIEKPDVDTIMEALKELNDNMDSVIAKAQ